VAPFECVPGQYISSADQYVRNNCKQCEAGSYCPGYGNGDGLNTYTGDRYNPSIQCTAGYTSPAGSSHYFNCTSVCTGELTFWNGTSCAQKHSIQYWCDDHLCSTWYGTNKTACVTSCQDRSHHIPRPSNKNENDCADQVNNWCVSKPTGFTFTPAPPVTNCIQSNTEVITSPCKCAASSTTNECIEGYLCYDDRCEQPVQECDADVYMPNLKGANNEVTSPCKCAASSTTNECLIGKYCYDGGCENAAKGTPTTSTQCSNIDASVFQRLSAKTCSE